MKQYLLGCLNEEESNQIEARYFADPNFLEDVQKVERDLIADYLDNALTQRERIHFEERYLRVPLLKQRFEEVSRQHAVNRRISFPPKLLSPRFLVAGGLTIGLLVGFFVFTKNTPFGSRSTAPQLASILRVSPGVRMSSSSSMAELERPLPNTTVQLRLEYPSSDNLAPVYALRISKIDNSGASITLWTQQPSAPEKDQSGLVYVARVDANLLDAGDYIAELLDSDSNRAEAYIFRILPTKH